MRPFYLLDTNIFSEPSKIKANPELIERYVRNQSVSAISVISWDEALYGVKRMPEGARKKNLEEYLIDHVQSDFEIIPFDTNAGWVYTDLKARLEKIGKPAPDSDLKIAATAIANGMILVTRNTKDFEAICQCSTLPVVNWFEQD